MTTKNSVLLIIKQFPGIEYHTLLSKTSANYGSVNSARAALSRALKDMNALAWIGKRDNHWFVTDKGQLILNSEMKNKLLFRLNQTIQTKENLNEIDAIVEQLSILIERSKNDPDLLKAAKNAVRFSITDLEEIQKRVTNRKTQLDYFCGILDKQIHALRELDFLDTRLVSPPEKIISIFQDLLSKNNPNELFVSANPILIDQIAQQLNEKAIQDNLTISNKNFNGFLEFLASQYQQEKIPSISISFSPFLIRMSSNQTTITAPFSKLTEL